MTTTTTTTIPEQSTIHSQSNSTTSTSTFPVPLIAGVSSAGMIVLVIIAAGSLWCWKSGRCCKCKKNESVIEKNESVIENNEMYGRPVDYSQYDKDEYDTKAVDNNDYYDSE